MNGRGVEGLNHQAVVQLLRESEGSVTLLISRQEVVEKQDDDEVLNSFLTMLV